MNELRAGMNELSAHQNYEVLPDAIGTWLRWPALQPHSDTISQSENGPVVGLTRCCILSNVSTIDK